MTERTENDALINAVQELYKPGTFDVVVDDRKITLLLAPRGLQRVPIAEAELDEARGAPLRCKGTINVASVDGLIALTNRYKDIDTIVYANGESITAVLNDHAPAAGANASPGFRDHRIAYTPAHSEEWTAWMCRNGGEMSQGEFAAFLEDHALDLIDSSTVGPATQKVIDALGVATASPADLRALARDLSVRIKQQVREARNLSTGEAQVIYATEHQGADGKPLIVPGAFVIAIPVFDNSPRYALVARLRYRITEGRILWSYRLAHASNATRDVFDGLFQRVRIETGTLVIEGNP